MFKLGPHELLWMFLIFSSFIPLSKIVHKAGFSGWWGLLCFVPVVGVVAIWYLAFAKWPALAGDPVVKAGQ
jgi:uncharacterized membrane protein YhaH (DUF805 family)